MGIRYLTLSEVLELYRRVMQVGGGEPGIRDLDALKSAVSQPKMSFGGKDLYPTLPEKAAALAYSLAQNHPFLDGNKRIAHAAMEVFLILNGYEIKASIQEQESVFLRVAAGQMGREELASWIEKHMVKVRPGSGRKAPQHNSDKEIE